MPKSRGRRKSAKAKPARRKSGPSHPADQLVGNARRIGGFDDALHAEMWASAALGKAWAKAELGDKEAEHQRCIQVAGRANAKPTPYELEALVALARVAPAEAGTPLHDAITALTKTHPLPSWSTDVTWTPHTAWRAVDVYDSARTLLIDYHGPVPHTLMADLDHVGGLEIRDILILPPNAAKDWQDIRPLGQVPMALTAAPAAEVLAELAHALRITDMTWPRNDDEDFTDCRSLAWSRCRDHLRDWPEHKELTESQRTRMIAEFLAHSDHGDDDSTARFLAGLLLDYGEGYIHAGPLHWSPGEVMVFLSNWLPRKAVLEPADREALPQVLRAWLTFALTRRGIAPEWISPVIAAVDTSLPDFDEAIDDETAWGPAKQLVNALTHRGVDFNDSDAINQAIRQLNAENQAHTPP
ncbi:hypothetical protein [Mycobacterium sp.]|uniref:hypothetical protein n=1 Tax=Mycobacterium sp. TaxID=1785 RepID=UPI003BACE0F3